MDGISAPSPAASTGHEDGSLSSHTSSVVHERQDSERDLMALFDTLVRPTQGNVVPMKDRKLPQSFFTPRSSSAMSTNSGMGSHSRDNSMESCVPELASVRPVVGHSRSFSAPAPSLYASSPGLASTQNWPAKQETSMDVGDTPLPAGFEQKMTEYGKVYYIK